MLSFPSFLLCRAVTVCKWNARVALLLLLLLLLGFAVFIFALYLLCMQDLEMKYRRHRLLTLPCCPNFPNNVQFRPIIPERTIRTRRILAPAKQTNVRSLTRSMHLRMALLVR